MLPIRSRSLILMYHRVASISRDPWSLCVTAEHFAEHLDVLRRHRRVRLDELSSGGWAIGSRLTVALTFDDGYADNLHQALPLLKLYDTPATFFITTGYLDSLGEFWWDQLERIVYSRPAPPGLTSDEWHLRLYRELQPLRHDSRREILDGMCADGGQPTGARASHKVLTSEELIRLASEDLVEIGAHSVTHPLLAALSAEEQARELRESKQWLESRLGRRVTSFSYPYGGTHHFTRSTVNAAADAGFTRACTTTFRCIRRSDKPLEWGRFHVPDVDGDKFEKFLFHAETAS